MILLASLFVVFVSMFLLWTRVFVDRYLTSSSALRKLIKMAFEMIGMKASTTTTTKNTRCLHQIPLNLYDDKQSLWLLWLSIFSIFRLIAMNSTQTKDKHKKNYPDEKKRLVKADKFNRMTHVNLRCA